MKVIRSKHAGACFGVQRALDMALAEADAGDDVKTMGPLIHNPQVVGELEAKGVSVLHEVPAHLAGTVIVRSHGVGPSLKGRLEASGARIVDATCPHVFRAQKAASDMARDLGFVVVVGDPQHPEVDAIREYAEQAGGQVVVADSPDAVPEQLPEQVGVVVQTTQNRAVFEQVLAVVRERAGRVEVRDTICSSTSKRQQAASELASQVDAMVVIGGHNSSNTTRLYEICKALCPKTYHIERVEELAGVAFPEGGTVGVTAGASTPENQIAPVVAYLERL